MRTPVNGACRRARTTTTRWGVALAAAVLLAGCGATTPTATTPPSTSGSASPSSAFPVTIENCGVSVTVEKPPTRAVTLNQGATETMLGLGLQDSMVGTAYLDDAVSRQWQAAYEKIPVLAKEYPSQEKLLGVEPDFVAASYSSAFDAKAAGSREDLGKLGITTYLSPFGCEDKTLRPKPTWEAIFGEIGEVATIFGDSASGQRVIDDQLARIEKVTAAAPAKGKTVFWYDSGDKTPTVGAGGGAPQLLVTAIGGTNIFASLSGGWADGSWEKVLSADPDLIVLADASWDTAEQKKKYLKSDPALKDLTAVKNDRFLTLPFADTTPGVRNAEGLASLAEQLAALK